MKNWHPGSWRSPAPEKKKTPWLLETLAYVLGFWGLAMLPLLIQSAAKHKSVHPPAASMRPPAPALDSNGNGVVNNIVGSSGDSMVLGNHSGGINFRDPSKISVPPAPYSVTAEFTEPSCALKMIEVGTQKSLTLSGDGYNGSMLRIDAGIDGRFRFYSSFNGLNWHHIGDQNIRDHFEIGADVALAVGPQDCIGSGLEVSR